MNDTWSKMGFRLVLAVILLAWTVLAVAVEAHFDALEKGGVVLDERGIVLENEYLRAGIATNALSGQILQLVYKPTGSEVTPKLHPQGYATDRMGESPNFWKIQGEGHQGAIVSQSEEKAEAQIEYVWNYMIDGKRTQIQLVKRYTLAKDAAALDVVWHLKNLGDQEVMMTPWVKHVGGVDGPLLAGPTILLSEQTPYDPGGQFVDPVTNWMVRLSGQDNSEALPMVASLTEFEKTFQDYPWRGKDRFSLETVFARITLKPGAEWETHYVVAVMPNLAHPQYVAPELAAGLSFDGEPAAGQTLQAELLLAPAVALGEVRLESELVDRTGRLLTKLPNRQITMVPGKINWVSQEFSLPAAGVYDLRVTVYVGQQIHKLGQQLGAQDASIRLPVVVGPLPAVVYPKWTSAGVKWPPRPVRSVRPWRTLVNKETVKAGQVLVPERVYPEDRLAYAERSEPGFIQLAGNEYEDLQFVVDFTRADDAVRAEVSVTSPAQENRAVLEQTDLLEAIYLVTKMPSSYQSFPIGAWPDPLFEAGWEKVIPDAPVTRANLQIFQDIKRRVFWLRVRAPNGAAPGSYRATVNIGVAGRNIASFPVEIRVRAFSLPKQPSYRTSTGMVGFGKAKIQSNLAILGLPPAVVEAKAASGTNDFWKMSLDYGWTPTMWGGIRMWDQYHAYGRGMSVFATGANPKEEAWLREKGVLDRAFIYAPFDEHADAVVPQVAEWCKSFREKSRVPILDCYYGNNVQPLFDLVNVWAGQDPTQPWARERKNKGDLFYSVNSSLVWYIEYEPITGRGEFWKDFATGVDGRYVYSTGRWTQDVYKENWTSGNYMGCVVYPGPAGLATSIRRETLRDGLEDYDYLTLLRGALKASQRPLRLEVIQETEAILGDTQLRERVLDVGALHALRARIADLIEAGNR